MGDNLNHPVELVDVHVRCLRWRMFRTLLRTLLAIDLYNWSPWFYPQVLVVLIGFVELRDRGYQPVCCRKEVVQKGSLSPLPLPLYLHAVFLNICNEILHYFLEIMSLRRTHCLKLSWSIRQCAILGSQCFLDFCYNIRFRTLAKIYDTELFNKIMSNDSVALFLLQTQNFVVIHQLSLKNVEYCSYDILVWSCFSISGRCSYTFPPRWWLAVSTTTSDLWHVVAHELHSN